MPFSLFYKNLLDEDGFLIGSFESRNVLLGNSAKPLLQRGDKRFLLDQSRSPDQ
jgi:hypothetical protein